MCLYFVNKEYTKGAPNPLIAEEDIVCYKMVKIYIDSKTRIDEETGLEVDDSKIYTYTPYKEYNLIPGKKIVDKHQTDITRGMIANGWLVEGGMFHTFARPPYIHGEKYGGWDIEYKIVLYAIIPKGAKYYKGYYNKREGYASSEIIITENAAYYKDYEKIVSEGNGKYRHLYETELSNRGHYIKALHIPLDENWFFDYNKMKGLKLEDLVYDTNRKESLWSNNSNDDEEEMEE